MNNSLFKIRSAAFLIDLFIFSVIFVVPTVIFFNYFLSLDFLFNNKVFFFSWTFFGVFIMTFKDFPSGISVGKRKMKLKVINSIENTSLSKFQLWLRNITIFIYPIEVLYLLIYKENQRLGDKLAKTQVIVINDTE